MTGAPDIPDTPDAIVNACAMFYASLPPEHRQLLQEMAEQARTAIVPFIAGVWTRAIEHHLRELAASRSPEEHAQDRELAQLEASHQQEMDAAKARHARRAARH